MTKAELRKEIKRQFLGHLPEELYSLSININEKLLHYESLNDASCIMAYYPLHDEVDILPLLSSLIKAGKQVLMPEVIGDNDMQLRYYQLNSEIKKGALGTSIPNTPIFSEYNNIDLILVPGRAFSNNGYRLGRGKGYYDRFLKQIPTAKKIGVCFPFQVLENIPVEPTDIQMDEVVY